MTSAPAAPCNIEAEQALLGAVLLNNAVMHQIVDVVRPEHFSEGLHGMIFEAAAAQIAAGKAASPFTLKSFLPDQPISDGVTVASYLARLVGAAAPPVTARDLAALVRDLHALRAISSIGQEMALRAASGEAMADPSGLAAEALGALQAVVETSGQADTRRDAWAASEALLERALRIMAHEEYEDAASTGYDDLDDATGGYQAGTFWIVGARPGMGKTTFVVASALKAAQRGEGAMIFSLEVTERQFMARMLADMVYRPSDPLPFGHIIQSRLTQEHVFCIRDAVKRLKAMPLVMDFASRLTTAEIAMRVRAEKRRMEAKGKRLRVVFIDYLKFVKATDRYRGNRVYEVGEISGALKQLAKDEGVCVVLLAQLNRALEGRDIKDRRPGLSDLRESGDLEADADVVIFVHREAYYLERTADYRSGNIEAVDLFEVMKNSAEIILGKNRAGATRTISLWCDIACSKLESHSSRRMGD